MNACQNRNDKACLLIVCRAACLERVFKIFTGRMCTQKEYCNQRYWHEDQYTAQIRNQQQEDTGEREINKCGHGLPAVEFAQTAESRQVLQMFTRAGLFKSRKVGTKQTVNCGKSGGMFL